MMTTQDARKVAAELYRLMRNDMRVMLRAVAEEERDEWLSSDEAARMLGVKASTLNRNYEDIPREKVGRKWRYLRSGVERRIRKNG